MNTIDVAAFDDNEDYSSVWLSIGDLMSGLLLLFALLFIVVLLQLHEAQENSKNKRRVIIGSIIEEFKNTKYSLNIDAETGDVSIREGILFDENSSVLKADGKAFLETFIPIYSSVIFKIHNLDGSNKSFKDEITRVIIEGHASSKGTDQRNLQLSLERALSVALFIIASLDFPEKSGLIQKLLPAGRGEIEANQDEDRPEDRRVMFRMQFKGEDFITWLRDIVGALNQP